MLFVNTVWSHGDLDHHIKQLDRQLLYNEDSQQLLLERGRLHFENGQFEKAKTDFEKLLQAHHDNSEALFYLAQAHLRLHNLEQAEIIANHFLAHVSSNTAIAKGAAVLSDIYAAKGYNIIALYQYSRVLHLRNTPLPDHFLRTALIAQESGANGKNLALAILNQGIKRIGPTVVLMQQALALEIELKAYNKAINRLNSMLKTAKGFRISVLLEQKARVFALKGDITTAHSEFLQAFKTIELLPPAKQQLAPVKELQKRIVEKINSFTTN